MSIKEFMKDQAKKITNSNCYKEVVSAITDDEHYGIKKDGKYINPSELTGR